MFLSISLGKEGDCLLVPPLIRFLLFICHHVMFTLFLSGMASTTTLVTDSQPDLNQQNGKTKENTPKSFEEMTVLEKVRVIPSYITAEPIMACYVMASVLCGPALNTLMIEKSCRVNLAYNDSTCDDIIAGQIQNLSKENTQVQEVIANMQTWQSPVQSVMPLILVLFLGKLTKIRYRAL